ncbi:hypothetical protein HOLleu_34674 [Holothuria leucospilota]|uniref:Uncharacterized protein n=1 Tax=Holothuria leucospilota TaxID=206669 RepID=A0A9Q0YLL1_HOLLE|nr:hypothetical protein HOLleu_34674 [Holothuria leucospilota]
MDIKLKKKTCVHDILIHEKPLHSLQDFVCYHYYSLFYFFFQILQTSVNGDSLMDVGLCLYCTICIFHILISFFPTCP